MKRGFTKSYSRGRLGEEQKRDNARKASLAYHMDKGDFERAEKLLEKWKGR